MFFTITIFSSFYRQTTSKHDRRCEPGNNRR